MSDYTPGSPFRRIHQHRPTNRRCTHIDHSNDIASSISALYESGQFSDVSLVVQGVTFNVHRAILAARSQYFRALLFGGLAESSSSVVYLNDISALAFRHLLKYIYTGCLRIRRLRTMLDVLGLAHQYDFHSLETALSTHLTQSLRLSNIWLIYNLAVIYNLEELITACLRFLDGIAPAPLRSPQFMHLSQAAIERLLSRDSFCAPEIEIFRSLCATFNKVQLPATEKEEIVTSGYESSSRQHSGVVNEAVVPAANSNTTSLGDTCHSSSPHLNEDPCLVLRQSHRQLISRCVRLELMSVSELLTEVRASKLVSADDLLDAISRQASPVNELPHRGWQLRGVNLAVPRFGCSLVAGEFGTYPYFFIESIDDGGDVAQLELTLDAIDSIAENGDLMLADHDLDTEASDTTDTDEDDAVVNVVPLPRGTSGPMHPSTSRCSSENRAGVLSTSHQNLARQIPNTSQLPAHPNVSIVIQNPQNVPPRTSDANEISHPALFDLGSTSTTQSNPEGLPVVCAAMHWLQLAHQQQQPGRGPTMTHPAPQPHSEHDVVRHSLDDPDAHIVIRLGRPSLINTIRMQLFDREFRCYSYHVELSLDQVTWVKIVDYRNYSCRSWQTLHFPVQVTRYIRITGSRNTSNRTFHLTTFRCLYSDRVCRQVDGFLVPTYNVACVEHGATVLEGVSHNRNALIDGNARLYDWNYGYTCHQLGSGAIVVQLAQPYFLRSMRFLLWDLDDRTYSYSVHVSTDREDWRLVHDARQEQCRSWQIITFPVQLVTFVRIVGSHNTANKVFHLVHLECPYPPADIRQDESDDNFSRKLQNATNVVAPPVQSALPVSAESTSEPVSYQATQATDFVDTASIPDPGTDPLPHFQTPVSDNQQLITSGSQSLNYLPINSTGSNFYRIDDVSGSVREAIDINSDSNLSLNNTSSNSRPVFIRHDSTGSHTQPDISTEEDDSQALGTRYDLR